MSLDTLVSDVIKRIYSAGQDSQAWDDALVGLFQLLGCRAGIASLVDLNQERLHQCRVYGPQHNGHCVEDYALRYRRDPTFVWAVNNPNSRFCDSRETMAPADYQADDFVRWTGKTFGSAFWVSGCAAPTNGLTFCLAAHFADEQAEESVEDSTLFKLLFDHLECALRLGSRPFSTESSRALLRLDENGTVKQVSRGAELLLRQRPVLTISNDRLVACNPAEQRALDQAFKQAAAKGALFPKPNAVQIKYDQGRPWIVIFRPVVGAYGPFGKVTRKVDVELLARVPAMAGLEVIQSLFDLTARELQVLRLLAHGHSIDSLSATIEISRNTTRAHLRSIYSKTKTNSQAELMQVCSGLSTATAERDLELLN